MAAILNFIMFLLRSIYTVGAVAQLVERPLCMRKVSGSIPDSSISPLFGAAFVSERSKELDSSSSVFALVGSNPTECISFLFAECLLLTLSFYEYNINY